METATVPRTDSPLEGDMEFADDLASGMPEDTGDTRTDAEVRVDYLLERIRTEREEIERIGEVAERRIQMIEEYRERESAKHERRIAWLEDQVRRCLPMDAARFEQEYGKKSVKLPHGRVGYRHVRETVEIADKGKALAWVKEHGIDYTVSERVTKTPILDWIREHGEVPPPEAGVELVEGYDSFYVSTD